MAQEKIKKVTREQLLERDSKRKIKLTGNSFSFAENELNIYEENVSSANGNINVCFVKMKNDLNKEFKVPLKMFATREYNDASSAISEVKSINGFSSSDKLVDIYDALKSIFNENPTFTVTTIKYIGEYEGRKYPTFVQALNKTE